MSEDAHAPRILLADDEPLMREMLTTLLSERGAIVTAADDGDSAVREAMLAPYDVCILDCDMARLGGLEACPLIIASSCTRDLPILFLTARSDSDTITKAFEAGAWDFLSKPVHPELLWLRVSNLLTLSAVKRERDNLDDVMKMSDASSRRGGNPAGPFGAKK